MILKPKVNSTSYLNLTPNNAIIAAGANSFSATQDAGNFINGPLSLSSPFTKIRFGGVYKFNSLLANTMPSNVITPIPVLELDLPIPEAAGLMAVTSMVVSTATAGIV
ncbi:MAG: hypothetical protein DRQ78_00880 [Epsilonproteobacteria bacterium]|nr:MAG: hypothetical protein DRQ78_00880 [Campylobacterota bacterium]